MPTIPRNKTDYKGVHYIWLKEKKSSVREKMYYIRYRKQGRLLEEKIGGELQGGMTPHLAAIIRENRINGPTDVFDPDDAHWVEGIDRGNKSRCGNEEAAKMLHKTFQRMPSLKMYQILVSLFNASSDGISVSDANGRIIVCNEASARLCGIGLEELMEKKCQDLVQNGVINRSITLEVLAAKRQRSIMMYITKTKKHLLVTGTPVFNESGNIVLVVVNERDITQLNDLREELEKSRLMTEKVRDKLAEISLLELRKQDIITESDQMYKVLQIAMKLAHIEASNVLIQGESGTGKGLLAKFIHNNSGRKKGPFIQISCAALPESLLEAELFGYEKGAFTGASQKGKAGLFELAHNGTLFLDEIGDLPQSVQAKLLKYLEDREIMHIGGVRTININCVIIAATNQNLLDQVKQGRFRNDLFFRLNEFTINIPPIRERKEDILALAMYYLKKYNRKYKSEKRFDTSAIKFFETYPFPGNVRELKNLLKKSIVIADDFFISKSLLMQWVDGENGEN